MHPIASSRRYDAQIVILIVLSQNAEIGLGTVFDIESAKKWLAGTFLYVRLGKNPGHYKFDKESNSQGLDDCIEAICQKDLDLLQATNLVQTDEKLKCTAFGDAMARYYIKFETMRRLLMLPPHSKMSETVSHGDDIRHETKLINQAFCVGRSRGAS